MYLNDKPIIVPEDRMEYFKYIPSQRILNTAKTFIVETKDNYVVLKNRGYEYDIRTIDYKKLNRNMFHSWQDYDNFDACSCGWHVCFDISDRV